jgi:hypothetical protein
MPGEIVAIYHGEVLNQQQYDNLAGPVDKSYFAQVGHGNDQYYIDAKITGGPARFIDHSCKPNCDLVKYIRQDGSLMLVLIANSIIKIFDQLSFYYNWFMNPGEKVNILCHCQALTSPHGIKQPQRKPFHPGSPLPITSQIPTPRSEATRKGKSTSKTRPKTATKSGIPYYFPPPEPAEPLNDAQGISSTGEITYLDSLRVRKRNKVSDDRPP